MSLSSKRRSSSSTTNNKIVESPAFADLPSDFHTNRSDYELWSIRMPINFDPLMLNHLCNEDEDDNDDSSGGGGFPCNDVALKESSAANGTVITRFQQILPTKKEEEDSDNNNNNSNSDNDGGEGTKYSMNLGNPSESSTFRILIPNDDDDDDMDGMEDEDEDTPRLKPLLIPFDKHMNILQISNDDDVTERNLAPSIERAPTPNTTSVTTANKNNSSSSSTLTNPKTGAQLSQKMRLAYTPIDQKKGLKRRWQMFGASTITSTTTTTTEKMNVDKVKKEQHGSGEKKKQSSTSSSKKKEKKSSKRKKTD